MSYKCEYFNESTGLECLAPATSEWRAYDEDEREVYATYRCSKHPETYFDEERPLTVSAPMYEMFFESIKPLNDEQDRYRGTNVCNACGVEYDDDDINAYAHAKARC